MPFIPDKKSSFVPDEPVRPESEIAIRAEYPSEKFAKYAEPISQFGGMLARETGIGAGLAGASTMGAEIARQGIQAIGGEPGAPKTFAESGKRIAGAFARGATGEALGRGVFKGAEYVGKSIASTIEAAPSRMINSLIKPRSKDFIYGKNPGKAVVDENIIAFNADDLAKKITERKQELGKMYDEVLSPYSDMTIDIPEALKPIDEAINSASKYRNVNAQVLSRLDGLRKDLIENIVAKDSTGKWGLNPQALIELKREIGDITKFTGNESDDKIVNSSLKKVYHYIDENLDKNIPGIKQLNERYANMLGAQNAIKWRQAIEERQNVFHIPELMTAGAVGIGTQDPYSGIGAGLAYKAAGTTLGKTMAAQAIQKGVVPATRMAGDVLSSPIVSEAGKLATRLGTQGVAEYLFPSDYATEQIRRKYMEKR